jgi:hypothetical protein
MRTIFIAYCAAYIRNAASNSVMDIKKNDRKFPHHSISLDAYAPAWVQASFLKLGVGSRMQCVNTACNLYLFKH